MAAPKDQKTPSPNKRRSSKSKSKRPSGSAAKDPFYRAAACAEGTSPAMYFEAKYYGPCPDVPTGTDAPCEVDIGKLLDAKREEGDRVRCNLYFSDKGIAVLSRDKQSLPVAVWKTYDVASCATIQHPNKKGRRIGMLKVRDSQSNRMMWHLFKYCCGKTDNMSDCFRYVVDCSLRDIGRAVTARAQQDLEAQFAAAAAGVAPQPLDDAIMRTAWPEPAAPPPRYERSQPAQRQLNFSTSPSDAADASDDSDGPEDYEAMKEAEDIARSEKRCSVDNFVYRNKHFNERRRGSVSQTAADYYIDVDPIQEDEEETV